MGRSTLALAALAACGLMAGCNGAGARIQMDPRRAWVDAEKTLVAATTDAYPSTRWVAIEALARTRGAAAGPLFVTALSDPSPAVRTAAAMAIGDTSYAPARNRLATMAGTEAAEGTEDDRRVYTALIYAQYRLGDKTHVADLATLLWDNEAAVRSIAALVMGKMEHPAAIKHLKMLLRDERDAAVQIQIVESLAVLGDRAAHRLLEAYAKTHFVDEQILAAQSFGKINSPRSEPVLREMFSRNYPPRVRVVAAGALGDIGEHPLGAYNLCIESARNPRAILEGWLGGRREITPDHTNSLRHLAAMSLGKLGQDGAVDTLHPLLDSSEGTIRVAAAMSILRLLGDSKGNMLVEPKTKRSGWPW